MRVVINCRKGGGQVKVYPYKKGDGKSFSHPKGVGGSKKIWGSFNMDA